MDHSSCGWAIRPAKHAPDRRVGREQEVPGTGMRHGQPEHHVGAVRVHEVERRGSAVQVVPEARRDGRRLSIGAANRRTRRRRARRRPTGQGEDPGSALRPVPRAGRVRARGRRRAARARPGAERTATRRAPRSSDGEQTAYGPGQGRPSRGRDPLERDRAQNPRAHRGSRGGCCSRRCGLARSWEPHGSPARPWRFER